MLTTDDILGNAELKDVSANHDFASHEIKRVIVLIISNY